MLVVELTHLRVDGLSAAAVSVSRPDHGRVGRRGRAGRIGRRGRDGGYEMLKDPEKIQIGPLLRTVDGPIAPLPCLSRTAYRRCEDCRDEARCELRIAFDKAYSFYLSALENTTLAEVMNEAGEPAKQLLLEQ